MKNVDERHDLKSLGITSVIVLAGGFVLHYLLKFLHVEGGLEITIFHLYCGIVPYVHHSLETRPVKPSLSLLPAKMVTLEGFAMPWYVMAIYGVSGFLALGYLGAIVGRLFIPILLLIGIIAEKPDDEVILSVTQAIAFFWELFTMFFIGRWIGIRCDKNRILTITAIAFIGFIIGTLIDLLVTTGFTGIVQSVRSMDLKNLSFNTVSFVIAGSAGLWMGNRERAAKYFQYLLGLLRADTREEIIQLAYEEAKRLSR